MVLFYSLIVVSPQAASAGNVVEIDIYASQFEYGPNEIRVKQGDRVIINLHAEDVTHGLYIDGYDISVTDMPRDQELNTLEFVADKPGKFTFRCNVVCGPMHPFMVGTLIVEPNTAFPIALVMAIGVGLGSLGYINWRGRKELKEEIKKEHLKIDLTKKYPWLDRLLKQRWLMFSLFAVNSFFFAIILYAGFAGTEVGNANFSLMFVWIVWWAALILILLPLGGRLWCAMCPLPAPGEWLDRKTFIERGRERPLSLVQKGWPKRFKNIWLQNWAFLAVALFSGIILTRPLATAIVLSAFIILAIVFSLKFGKRIFCRYICPVGGFIGLYSLVAPLEVRVRDTAVCKGHKEKECIMGNDKGHGCPWMEVPWNIRRNAYCGMCTECFKTCSQNNISLNWGSFGAGLLVDKGKSMDEAYKAFIMMNCALLYSIVFQGPWGILKSWANLDMPGFFIYAAGFFLLNLAIVPLIFALAVWLSKGLAEGSFMKLTAIFTPIKELYHITKGLLGRSPAQQEAAATVEKEESGKLPTFSKLFVNMAYVLVPMGLAGWMAFSVSFLFVNFTYILHVISDPFGWGWNFFGTKDLVWKPVGTGVYPYIQAIILFGGLAYSNHIGAKLLDSYQLTRQAKLKALVPITGFLTLVTGVFLWLYL